MNKPRGEGAWWRSAGQRRTWVTPSAPTTATRSAAPAAGPGGGVAPDASDPGVNSLIDGLMGDKPTAPRTTAAAPAVEAAPQRAGVAAPPRPRQPIHWPPRPLTESEVPPKPVGLVSRLATAIRGTKENTNAGLRTRTRVAVVIALTAAIVIAAVITTRALAVTTSTNFAGVLAAETPIQLNFAQNGTLATIDVTPGENVVVGQVLATESSTVQAAAVKSDNLALASDEQHLGQLLGKAGAAAEAQAAAEYQKVESLASTQEARGAESVVEETSVLQSANQLEAAANQQLVADQATYNSKCKGLGQPGCASLSRDVSLDQTNLTAAEARVSRAEQALASAQSIDTTLQGLATTENALAAANPNNVSITVADEISAARDSIAHDLAQLAADEANLQGTTLVSPVAGKVEETNGVPDELTGPANAKSGGVSSSTGVPTSGSTPSGPSTVTGNAGTLPLVTIEAAPGLEAIAQVPEDNIAGIAPGESATITVDALGGKTFAAKVAAVEQISVVVQGSVYYDVVLTSSGPAWSGDLLPGMTANVTIG